MSFFRKAQRQLFSSAKLFSQRLPATEATESSVLDADFNFNNIPACPSCASNNVAIFSYGKPQLSSKIVEGLETGKIISGGCMIHKTSPKWHCHNCNKDFGRLL